MRAQKNPAGPLPITTVFSFLFWYGMFNGGWDTGRVPLRCFEETETSNCQWILDFFLASRLFFSIWKVKSFIFSFFSIFFLSSSLV